jgi:hypothetical protein|tara:strand:+ start:236 stop:718 length:483 start_codon:yes stop_codon:yes gene_type:complete
MAGAALLNPLRRVGISLITRVLRKDVEEAQAKKHPERNRHLRSVVTRKRAIKKHNKLVKKTTREVHKKRYETDPIYRRSTIRPAIGGEKYDIQIMGPLRKTARSDPNYLMRTHSQNLLKKFTDFRDATPWPLLLKSKERKKHKIRKQEDARANSILTGDV